MSREMRKRIFSKKSIAFPRNKLWMFIVTNIPCPLTLTQNRCASTQACGVAFPLTVNETLSVPRHINVGSGARRLAELAISLS